MMVFEKRMIILIGERAKGTVKAERNALGLSASVRLFGAPKDRYRLVVQSGEDRFRYNLDDKGSGEVKLPESLDLAAAHFAVVVERGAVAYGTLARERLWSGNLPSYWEERENEANGASGTHEEKAAETFAFSRRGDIFLDIFPSATEYADNAIAAVNYYEYDEDRVEQITDEPNAIGKAEKQSTSKTHDNPDQNAPDQKSTKGEDKVRISELQRKLFLREYIMASAKSGETEPSFSDKKPTAEQPSVNPPTTEQPPVNPSSATESPPVNPPTTAEQPSVNPPTTEQPPVDAPTATEPPPVNPPTTAEQNTFASQPIGEDMQAEIAFQEFTLPHFPLDENPTPETADPDQPLPETADPDQPLPETYEKDGQTEPLEDTAHFADEKAETRRPIRPLRSLRYYRAEREKIRMAAAATSNKLEETKEGAGSLIFRPAAERVRGRRLTYFEQVEEQVKKLFASGERETELEKLLPHTQWVRVDYSGNGKHYVVGLVGEKPDYFCYGLPGVYSSEPPAALDGYGLWLPLSVRDPQGKGYWLLYQDAETGESVRGTI